mmetsp:Transcript_131178/g.261808  ORF Transcript_131178/g.261808 Transcript_131178/m.261808 type:complete len:90 (-) Transcript_131178:61-330(-)
MMWSIMTVRFASALLGALRRWRDVAKLGFAMSVQKRTTSFSHASGDEVHWQIRCLHAQAFRLLLSWDAERQGIIDDADIQPADAIGGNV